MRDSPDPSPFANAAAYYDGFRAPYAPEALAWVVDALRLGAKDRVLDLGCGPGKLAIPLSCVAGEVVAVDSGPEMLAEGRRLAGERGAGRIRWIEGRAEDLAADVG